MSDPECGPSPPAGVDAAVLAGGDGDGGQPTEEEYPLRHADESERLVDAASPAVAPPTSVREAREDAELLRVVLERRPHSHRKGAAERWDEAAEAYYDRLGLHDPSERVGWPSLRQRVDRLHKLYCGTDSPARAALTPELLGLLAQYHSADPGKRVPGKRVLRGTQDDEARPRPMRRQRVVHASPPPTLLKLDLRNDIRMVRAYLDGAFLIYQADGWVRSLLETAAAARGAEWSRDHAIAQLNWLTKAWISGDSTLLPASPAHQRLRDLLADYADCIPKLYGLHRKINPGTVGVRRTLDDVLLEDVLDLQPFAASASEAEHAVWHTIATRFNKRLEMKVMFTSRLCFDRFHSLRDAWLAGGDSELSGITRNQDQKLREIEDLISLAPVRPREAPPGDEDNGHDDIGSPVVELETPLAASKASNPPETDNSKLVTLLLKEVVAQQPFQTGEVEMLVWDKIRADVNFEMRREVVASRDECRARVVGLLQARDLPSSNLTSEQAKLLEEINARGGISQLALNERGNRVEAVPERVGLVPSGRDSARGRGRGCGRGSGRPLGSGRGPGRPPGSGRGPGRPPGSGRGRGHSHVPSRDQVNDAYRVEGSGSGRGGGRLPSSVQPLQGSLTNAERLEQRVNALSEELATIKRHLLTAQPPEPARTMQDPTSAVV